MNIKKCVVSYKKIKCVDYNCEKYHKMTFLGREQGTFLINDILNELKMNMPLFI